MSLSVAISPARLTFRSTTTLRTFARRGTLDRARFRAFPLRAMATLVQPPRVVDARPRPRRVPRPPQVVLHHPRARSSRHLRRRRRRKRGDRRHRGDLRREEADHVGRAHGPPRAPLRATLRPWGVVSHLKGVRDSEALREAYDACQPEVVAASLRIGQSRPVYGSARRAEGGCLRVVEPHPAQRRRRVRNPRRQTERRRAGRRGEGGDTTRSPRNSARCPPSSPTMSSTPPRRSLTSARTRRKSRAFPSRRSSSPRRPPPRRSGREGANAEDGPWMFTLDAPSYMAVRMHAEKPRAPREGVRARASDEAPPGFADAAEGEDGKKKGDNAPLIERILTLRAEKAKLLGFDNFAEVSMAKKMATLESADSLLEDIRSRARAAAGANWRRFEPSPPSAARPRRRPD